MTQMPSDSRCSTWGFPPFSSGPQLSSTSCGDSEPRHGLPAHQHWIVRHREPLTFYPSAVLGLVLVIDGVVQLVG